MAITNIMSAGILDSVVREVAAQQTNNVVKLLRIWLEDHEELRRNMPLIITRYRREMARHKLALDELQHGELASQATPTNRWFPRLRR